MVNNRQHYNVDVEDIKDDYCNFLSGIRWNDRVGPLRGYLDILDIN